MWTWQCEVNIRSLPLTGTRYRLDNVYALQVEPLGIFNRPNWQCHLSNAKVQCFESKFNSSTVYTIEQHGASWCKRWCRVWCKSMMQHGDSLHAASHVRPQRVYVLNFSNSKCLQGSLCDSLCELFAEQPYKGLIKELERLINWQDAVMQRLSGRDSLAKILWQSLSTRLKFRWILSTSFLLDGIDSTHRRWTKRGPRSTRMSYSADTVCNGTPNLVALGLIAADLVALNLKDSY